MDLRLRAFYPEIDDDEVALVVSTHLKTTPSLN